MDQTGLFSSDFKSNDTYKYHQLNNTELSIAKDLTKSSDYYGLLVISNLNENQTNVQFFSDDTPSISVISDLERLIEKKLTQLNYTKRAIDISAIKDSQVNITIAQENFSGQK